MVMADMFATSRACRTRGIWRTTHSRHPHNKLRGCQACPRGRYDEIASMEFSRPLEQSRLLLADVSEYAFKP